MCHDIFAQVIKSMCVCCGLVKLPQKIVIQLIEYIAKHKQQTVENILMIYQDTNVRHGT